MCFCWCLFDVVRMYVIDHVSETLLNVRYECLRDVTETFFVYWVKDVLYSSFWYLIFKDVITFVAYFSEYIFIYQKVCISEIIRYMVLSKSLFSNKRYFMKFLFFYTSGLKEDRDCQFGGLFQDNFFILDIVCLWSAEGYMLQKVYSGVPSKIYRNIC